MIRNDKMKFMWNFIGQVLDRIINRMKTGDNRNMTNWKTIGDRKSYSHADLSAFDKFQPIIAHTFWHGEIGVKQLFSIKSFLCTQPKELFELWIWLDGDEWYEKALQNNSLMALVCSQDNRIKIKKWDLHTEIKGTIFSNISWYFQWVRPLAYMADDFRIIALYKFGGLYFDLDVMFLRDFTALVMRDEFVYAWENQPFANNAILYLRKGSYLCRQVASEMIRRKSSQPWIVFRYKRKTLASLMVYPCAFFDPLWTGYEKGMPFKAFGDFFKPFDENFPKDGHINSYRDFFHGAYAYHWHNHWNNKVVENSYFGMFNKEFEEELKQQ